MADGFDARVQVHAALADPVRLAIVDELAVSDRSPTELGQRVAVRSNLLAHHLDVLEAAGLIERVVSTGDARRRYVRLRPDSLAGSVSMPVLRAAGVVFVCTRNSARSPLAEAMWNRCSHVPATSAGTEPGERVHPEAVRAGERLGLDLTGAEPRTFDAGSVSDRLVVTVCDLAHEDLAELEPSSDLPVLHWSIPDPAESGRSDDFDAAAEVLDSRVRPALVPVVATA